jgi:hypothetical protein
MCDRYRLGRAAIVCERGARALAPTKRSEASASSAMAPGVRPSERARRVAGDDRIQAKGEATATVPHAHLGRRRAVIRGDVSSTGHGVPMAMRDPPLALLATVNLRGPQGVRARLAVDRGRGVLEAGGVGHVPDHVVRE